MTLRELYLQCPDNILVVDDLLDENILMYIDHNAVYEPAFLSKELLDAKIEHIFTSEQYDRTICVVLEDEHE